MIPMGGLQHGGLNMAQHGVAQHGGLHFGDLNIGGLGMADLYMGRLMGVFNIGGVSMRSSSDVGGLNSESSFDKSTVD